MTKTIKRIRIETEKKVSDTEMEQIRKDLARQYQGTVYFIYDEEPIPDSSNIHLTDEK